ncbi:unnamed protein product, partial [Discosporangium mesarthrocarpum]
AREALATVEAKLARVEGEKGELQEAGERVHDRCRELESELENVSGLLFKAEEANKVGKKAGEVQRLETELTNLEEELRRSEARCTTLERDMKEGAGRSKRVQNELEMMRAEYERVSDEAMDLQVRLKATEEEAAASNKSEDLVIQLDCARAAAEEARAELEEERSASKGRIAEVETASEEKIAAAKAAVEEAEVKARMEGDAKAEAEGAVVRRDAELAELVRRVGQLSREVEGEGARATEVQVSLEEAREQLVALKSEGVATEKQLRHRLESQVTEVKSLRTELKAEREKSAELERTSIEARAGVQAQLLTEMEGLMEAKMEAEERCKGMERELGILRESLGDAEKRAAEEQSMVVEAAQQRIQKFKEAVEAKQQALEKAEADLESERAQFTSAATSQEEVAALKTELSALREGSVAKDARIAQLEAVRLTKGMVEKINKVKERADMAASENKHLRERLAAVAATSAAATEGKGCGSGSKENDGMVEQVRELETAKGVLSEKLRRYAKHVHRLEQERGRVRQVLLDAGTAPQELDDLAEAVLELSEKALGDTSVVSTA